MESLVRWNTAAAVAHGTAALGFAALLRPRDRARRLVTITRTGLDTTGGATIDKCNHTDFPLAAHTTSRFDPRTLVVSFFVLTAAAHAFYAATGKPGGAYYKAVAERGSNPFRWFEYALSASVMAALVASLDGSRDRGTLTLIASSIAAMNLQGLVVERALKQGPRSLGLEPASSVDGTTVLTASLSGWLLVSAAWYVILSNFSALLKDAKVAAGDKVKIPSWLIAIGATQSLFFSSFGAVQMSQIASWRADLREGRAKGASFIGWEKLYIALSFGAKLTLGSLVAFGMTQKEAGCP